jgi:SM-20-related protein
VSVRGPELPRDAVEIGLDARLDPRTAHAIYVRDGRVHIANALTESAAVALHACLRNDVDWRMNFNLGERAGNLSAADVAQIAEIDRLELNRHFLATAQSGFQYVYANWPCYDLWQRGESQPAMIERAMAFLNGQAFLDVARRLTGVDAIVGADAQATRYGPGHFLTAHDDSGNMGGRTRVAAYVLNLTPEWRPDWGGMLQFLDDVGHVEAAYMPMFNALNVFRVPKRHAVSYVTPFTATYRYSISGWFFRR